MEPLNINISVPQRESATSLPNSKGAFKSRIHLYDYKGEEGKDRYAIAAKILNKPRSKLNFIERKYFVIIEQKNIDGKSVLYKVNKKSLQKRLGITKQELKSNNLIKIIRQRMEDNLQPEYFKAKIEPILQDKDRLAKIPKAEQGVTAHSIYILEENDLPLVIRAGINVTRAYKATQAHAFAQEKGLDLLAIPKPWFQGNFMIERQIPVVKGGMLGPMAFYYQNQQAFGPAIEQFVLFLGQSSLIDLVGNTTSALNDLFPGFPRYDNLLVFEEEVGGEKSYKIGLIDTETFQLLDKSPSREQKLEALEIAIRFFPYNFEEIIKAGKKLGLTLTATELESLKKEQSKWLDCFEKIIGSPLKHFEKHDISAANPSKILPIPPIQSDFMDALKDRLAEKLLELHHHGTSDDPNYGYSYKALNCLGDSPKEVIQFYKDHIFPGHIDLLLKALKEASTSIEEKTPKSIYELLNRRIVTTSNYFGPGLKAGFNVPDGLDEKTKAAPWFQDALQLDKNLQVRKILLQAIGEEMVKAGLISNCGTSPYDDKLFLLF